MKNVVEGREQILFYIGTHDLESRFYMLPALVAYVPANNNSSPFWNIQQYSSTVLDRGPCPDTLALSCGLDL